MDFSVNRSEISEPKPVRKETLEQAIDCDITLPEYYEDVQRVLKCTLMPSIQNVQKSGDRVTVEGVGTLSILYLSDENKMQCFTQNVAFTRWIEGTEISAVECNVTAETEYVNCRVVSGCRLEIHGSISLHFCCFQKDTQNILCDCSGCGVEIQPKALEVCTLTDCCTKGFTLNETFELGEGNPPVMQFVHYCANAVLESTKIVSGKILVKGNLLLRILYLSDKAEDCLERIEHTMPISQIIDIAGAEETCIDVTKLCVCGLDVSARADSSGAMRFVEVTANLSATIETYIQTETKGILDAYSTKYALSLKRQNVPIHTLCDRFSDTYLCRDTLDVSGTPIAKVLDMTATDITCTPQFTEGVLLLKGTITVALFLQLQDGSFIWTPKQFPYEYKKSGTLSAESIECTPSITITGADYLLRTEDKVDVRVEIAIHATVFSVHTVPLVVEITPDESKPKAMRDAALTIYFAEKGESLWEIAQQYNTTMRAVMAENELTETLVPEKCKLLIPRA